MSGAAGAERALARPVWADVDLDAVSHNLALVRERAGRPVRVLATVKANAYGHGVVAVGRHLESLGVDGLATANVDDAIDLRDAGVTTRILLFGAPLPDGFATVLAHGLTPTVYDLHGVGAVARAAAGRTTPIPVHVKVDMGLGRLGVRPEAAPELARAIVANRALELEGIYTHIPFDSTAGEAWSRRRLAAFTELVAAIEAEHGVAIPFTEAGASSVLTAGLADTLTTVAPGHLLYGLSPVGEVRAEDLGFRKALTAVRANLIHVGRRELGDLAGGAGPVRRTGVILFGIDNGYRTPPSGDARAEVLVRGRRCPVLSVSAEYAVVGLDAVADAAVGDAVTVIGADGGDRIAIEDVAAALGAPSAAYWMLGMKHVPLRYTGA